MSEPSLEQLNTMRNTGISKSQYTMQRYRWLKERAAKEGYTGSLSDFVPEGYNKAWVAPKAPNQYYWKPEDVAKTAPLYPSAVWDTTQKYQGFWGNPRNIGYWKTYIDVHKLAGDYPEWLTSDVQDFIKNQYKVLKTFNESEDWANWEPLPFGTTEQYVAYFQDNPVAWRQRTQTTPQGYATIPEKYQAAVDEAALAQQQEALRKQEVYQTVTEQIAQMDEDAPASAILKALEGKIPDEDYQQLVANIEKLSSPENQPFDWNEMTGWQQVLLSLTSTAKQTGRPGISVAIPGAIQATLAGFGTYGVVGLLGGLAAAVGGAAAAPAIGIIAAVAGAGVAAYTFARSQGANINVPAVDKLLRVFNLGAEAVERTIGSAAILSELAAPREGLSRGEYIAQTPAWKPEEMKRKVEDAWVAASLTYELNQPVSKTLINTISAVAGTGVAGKGEVWELEKGYSTPQKALDDIGVDGLMEAYRMVQALGPDRTKGDLEAVRSYWTAVGGYSGNLNDFIIGMVADPANFAFPAANKVIADYADFKYTKAMDAGDIDGAIKAYQLNQAAKSAQGNLAIDALPMGVQQAVEGIVRYFEGLPDYRAYKRNIDSNITLKQYKKMGLWQPSTHGTLSIVDTINMYNAMKLSGYGVKFDTVFDMNVKSGDTTVPVKMEISPKGDVTIKYGDVSRFYTSEELGRGGVAFGEDAQGNLIVPQDALNAFAQGIVETATKPKGTVSDLDIIEVPDLNTEKLETIDGTGGTYSDLIVQKLLVNGNETTDSIYIYNKDGNTYYVRADDNVVLKAVDKEGNPITLDGVYKISPEPVKVGEVVLDQNMAELAANLESVEATIEDLKGVRQGTFQPEKIADLSPTEAKQVSKLLSVFPEKVVRKIKSLTDQTPSSKAIVYINNFVDTLQVLLATSGNNPDLFVNSLRYIADGMDTFQVTDLAKAFIQDSGAMATLADGFKAVAAADGPIVALSKLYNDSLPQRQFIKKAANILGMSDTDIVKIEPETLRSKLVAALSGSTDEADINMRQMLSNGELSTRYVSDILAPFKGKKPLPVNDQAFIIQVSNIAIDGIQDFLIKEYNITPKNWAFRLAELRKQVVTTQVITLSVPTWIGNLISNIATPFFFTGMPGIANVKKMKADLQELGIYVPETVSGFGLTREISANIGKINKTINPGDWITKTKQSYSKLVDKVLPHISKIYPNIEDSSRNAVYIQAYRQAMNIVPNDPLPTALKTQLKTGLSDAQIETLNRIFNSAISPDQIDKIINPETRQVTLRTLDMADGFNRAIEKISGGDAATTEMFKDLANKMGIYNFIEENIKNVKTPDDVYAFKTKLIEEMDDSIHRYVTNDLLVRAQDVANTVGAEGVAGTISVFGEALMDYTLFRQNIMDSWDDVMYSYRKLMEDGNSDLAHAIYNSHRHTTNKRYTQEMLRLETTLSCLANTMGLDGKEISDAIMAWHNEAVNALYTIDAVRNRYFSAAETETPISWDDVISQTDYVMKNLDTVEAETLKKIGDIWVDMLTKQGAPLNPLFDFMKTSDYAQGARELMDEFNKGFAELREMRNDYYKKLQTIEDQSERAAYSEKFWNEEWRPKIAEIRSNFVDGNYEKFFKVRATGTELQTEPLPLQTQPVEPIDIIKTFISKKDIAELPDKLKAQAELEGARATLDIWMSKERLGSYANDMLMADYLLNKKGVKWLNKIGESADSEKINAEIMRAIGISHWDEIAGKLDEYSVTPELPEISKPTAFTPETLQALVERVDALEAKYLETKAIDEAELYDVSKATLDLQRNAPEGTLDSALLNTAIEKLSKLAKLSDAFNSIKANDLLSNANPVKLVPLSEIPVGTSEVNMDYVSGIEELIHIDANNIARIMADELQQNLRVETETTYNFASTPEANAALGKWIEIVKKNISKKQILAMDYGKSIVNDTLLDYSRKRGIDDYLNVIFPYQFWYTRSITHWAKRLLTQPKIAGWYAKYEELLRKNALKGYPARLGGKMIIHLPKQYLPDYLGSEIFIDPMQKLFAPKQLFQPLMRLSDLNKDLTNAAAYRIRSLVAAGAISEEDALKAIEERSGQIWDDAVAYVKLNEEAATEDPMTLASMFLSPSPEITALYYGLTGQPEKIYPMPITRLGNAMETWGRDSPVAFIGKLLSAPGDWWREKAGISILGEFGEYWTDNALLWMVVEGADPDEAIDAMDTHSGPLYEEALYRAQEMQALKYPGTLVAKAIEQGEYNPVYLVGLLGASMFPAGIYPPAEMETRGLKDEYQKAWTEYLSGNPDSLNNFYEEYPEYQVRNFIFKEPEERMRAHMINLIWERYIDLPTPDKQQVADALGEEFKVYFLDSETRNYEAIDLDTYTVWVRALGYEAPETEYNKAGAKRTVPPIQRYPEDVSAEIQTFIDTRKQLFPNYYWLNALYYKLPEGSYKREKLENDFPELNEYRNWLKEYKRTHPTVASYLEERAAKAGSDMASYPVDYTSEQWKSTVAQFDPNLLTELMYYTMLRKYPEEGDPEPILSEGASAELMVLWEELGRPGDDFELWLEAFLGL